MKNNINDLRNHLFDVMERLKDPEPKTPIDCETAEAICLVAKRLIETAEVELKYRALAKKDLTASDFLRLEEVTPLKKVGIAS